MTTDKTLKCVIVTPEKAVLDEPSELIVDERDQFVFDRLVPSGCSPSAFP